MMSDEGWVCVPEPGERVMRAGCVILQVHRGLMLLAVSFISVAFTLPFVYRGGWSKVSSPLPHHSLSPLPSVCLYVCLHLSKRVLTVQ